MMEELKRENIQLEKLKLLKPVNNNGDGALLGFDGRKLSHDQGVDAKALAKEIEDEINERVRSGVKADGSHCEQLVSHAERLCDLKKTNSNFIPTTSTTPIQVFVTIHLKAKNAKRLLTKVATLADVCNHRGIAVSDNLEVYFDAKGNAKGDFEVVCAPEMMANSQRGMQKVSNLRGQLKRGDSLKTTALKLPSLGPVETVTHKRKDNSSNLSEKVLQDGSVFRGHLKGDKPHGFGSIVYAADDSKQRVKFAGDFEEGIRKGSGCLVWKDGAQYAGDWFGDKPGGFGIEKYPDGSTYIGQYENDMRHGFGTYVFPSGAKYEGCWYLGKRHGKALEQSKKGTFVVEFEGNKRIRQLQYLQGADDDFERLLAKVRAAVERGKSCGDAAERLFEREFQVGSR
uniref:Uncharacterized protein n=1 Tax=Hanusia phi TaxID=3032 RepID=A0A7S0F0D0_9CRYP|mmetsp:Transcript_34708/g.78364  ORF Transcript_34708/g.78364 Transcript_34708/m.78364 type:complete len:399 (+) Transcript_34708:79-1275(+)